MVNLRSLTVDQAKFCMQNGEFAPEIISSKERVAVVLTQSWCPQWHVMSLYLKKLTDLDLDIWLFMYDQSSIFTKFMHFKETVLKNDQIPYIRYYRNGVLVNESNLVEQTVFIQNFEKKSAVATEAIEIS